VQQSHGLFAIAKILVFIIISIIIIIIIIIYLFISLIKIQVQIKHMYIRPWAETARLDNQH